MRRRRRTSGAHAARRLPRPRFPNPFDLCVVANVSLGCGIDDLDGTPLEAVDAFHILLDRTDFGVPARSSLTGLGTIALLASHLDHHEKRGIENRPTFKHI